MNIRGFSLVENMVAMMLLSLVLTGGMGLCYYSQELTKLAAHKRMATEMVSAKIEAVKASAYAAIASEAATNITIGTFTATEVVTVNDIDDPANGTPDFKEVNVSLSWSESGKQTTKILTAKTYIAP